MSGAAGHLSHLHENRNLTFAELKDVLTSASHGELECVSEKYDGINIVFTWNSYIGDVSVARTTNDIKSGGLTREQLASKFAGRGAIADAFNQSFVVL